MPLIGLAITTLYGPKIEREAYANLEAIAKLKAEQIENWRDERQDDIKVLAVSPGFVEHVDKFTKQQTASSREAIQKRLNLLRSIHGYDRGLLFDTKGQLLLTLAEHDDTTADLQQLLHQSLVSKQIQRGDLYRDEAGNIHLERNQGLALLTQKMKADHELEIADVSLKESQVRNQSLIDAALDGVITMSEDDRIASWNPQATRIFGYSLEQALGENIATLIAPPQYRQAHTQGIARFIKTGTPTIIGTRIETMGQHANGSEFPIELSISAIKQEKGYFFSAYVRDITKRKKTENELRKSERLLRDSQQAANIGCYIVNFETGTWECTPTLNRLFGITEDYPHTIEGWVNLLHSDFTDTLKDYFLEVMRDRKSFDAEYKIIRPSDRAERWMHGLGQIVYDEKNNTVSLVGTVQDITKRKEMLDALTVSENEFHSLAEAMPQIVWVTLADGWTIYINQRWVDYTLYRPHA